MLYQLLVSAVAAVAVQTSCQEEAYIRVCLDKTDAKPALTVDYLNDGPILQGNGIVNVWYNINNQNGTKFEMNLLGVFGDYKGRTATIKVLEAPEYNVELAFFGPRGKYDSKDGQNYRFKF